MKPSNPPAYPAPNFIVPRDLEEKNVHRLGQSQGMTLRDYFAAAALPAAIAALDRGLDMTELPDEDSAATMAYDYADAMLMEREKREKGGAA